jgi:hypothetical protein
VTCCYFEVLHRWQPILLSWIGAENAETFSSHFLTLFISIGDALQNLDKEEDDLNTLLSVFNTAVAMVVDFSDAERKGFQLAYAKFFTTTAVGKEILDDDCWLLSMNTGLPISRPSFDDLYSTAGALLKGCLQHWRESVNRIARNHVVIPHEEESHFCALISLLYNAHSITEFNSLVEKIRTGFPQTRGWLDWWLRIEHAKMLFPCIATLEHEESHVHTSHLQGMT